MSLEKLDFDIYYKYLEVIERYMELVPCNQKERVDTATLHIMYAIQDINYQIEQYKPDTPSLSVYYQLMIKTDFLVGVIEALYEVFFDFGKDKRKDIWKDDYQQIRLFRLYRSLTLAHPLSTTYFNDLGYGNKNIKWCEDVRPKSRFYAMLDKRLSNADFIIEVKENGKKSTEKIPITIQDHILPVVMTVLSHLDVFTNKIVKNITTEIEKLRRTPIRAKRNKSIFSYINSLLTDVEERYPSEIEKIEYVDNTIEVKCVLHQAEKMLRYTFLNSIQEKKYKIYKNEIECAVYNYGNSVQNMNLEETKAHDKLIQILYPNSTILSSISKLEDAHYRYEKITCIW